jgi:hypothetical protein
VAGSINRDSGGVNRVAHVPLADLFEGWLHELVQLGKDRPASRRTGENLSVKFLLGNTSYPGETILDKRS